MTDISMLGSQVLEIAAGRHGFLRHLRVWRHDGEGGITWEQLQAVKDERLGREVLAVEVYPPAWQVANETNMRHLWEIPEGCLPMTLLCNLGGAPMKCGIVKMSAMARLGTWSPRAIFADTEALDKEIDAARQGVARAEARLRQAEAAKRAALDREAALVAAGDLVLITPQPEPAPCPPKPSPRRRRPG